MTPRNHPLFGAPWPTTLQRHLPWVAVWAVGTLVLALLLGRLEWARQRDQFDAAAHAIVPLLEQRLAANDAALAGLAQAPHVDARARIVQRLAQTHHQVLAVVQRNPDASWGDQGLHAAEQRSLATRQAELAHVNLPKGRYTLVLAAEPVSYALQIDFNAMVAWADWPMSRQDSPIRVTLTQDGAPGRPALILQSGRSAGTWRGSDASARDTDVPAAPVGAALGRWQFDFSQPLQSSSQKFVVTATRQLGLAELPWSHLVNGSLALAWVLLALRALLRQHHDRLRAGELLRMGQLGRLNTLSELAAGMSRELKGPLSSALAAIQATQKQLAHDGLEPAAQVEALAQNTLAEEELRRASDVILRLNHVVERPDLAHRLTAVNLGAAARHALDVLQPELSRLAVQARLVGPDLNVMADYGALQQIIHQLVMNALQAMQDSPTQQRHLTLTLSTNARPNAPGTSSPAFQNAPPSISPAPAPSGHFPAGAPVGPIRLLGRLSVQDTGPGLDNRVLNHIFEPFFTTRQEGLGLGLSLCETFANAMGGSLTAFNHPPHGAEFCLSLHLVMPA